MKRFELEAMATEFSLGCVEKCKIFFEKSNEVKFVKSSQLEDFLRFEADFEPEFDMEPDEIELLVLFKADGLRKIDLSA